MKIFTIGFTKKPAEAFFTLLSEAGVQRLIDVRLNNTSQLAGFTKKDDLRYFVRAICGIEYLHLPELAPTPDILDAFKKQKSAGWELYQRQFLYLMRDRRIEQTLDPEVVDEGCLLCSEETPEHCHRPLVAEYLQQCWEQVEIVHLG